MAKPTDKELLGQEIGILRKRVADLTHVIGARQDEVANNPATSVIGGEALRSLRVYATDLLAQLSELDTKARAYRALSDQSSDRSVTVGIPASSV